MSLFTKVPKADIVAPTAGADRSSANGEIRINQTFSSLIQFQDNLYNYLDKTGVTFPSPNNTGLEANFIANQAIRSEHLTPRAGGGGFQSIGTTLNNFNEVFVSTEIPIVVPFDNARIIWWVTYQYTLNAVSGNAATQMSEVTSRLKRSATSGFVATSGTTIFSKNNRAGINNNRIDDDFSFVAIDTIATAGTYFYRFTAQETQNPDFNRSISGNRSTYAFLLTNGFN